MQRPVISLSQPHTPDRSSPQCSNQPTWMRLDMHAIHAGGTRPAASAAESVSMAGDLQEVTGAGV